MDTKVNSIVVGAFVVFLTTAMLVAAIWIAGGHHTKSYGRYLTYVDDGVGGLTEKSPIKFNGVNVGFVDEIALNPINPQQVRIVLEIDSNTPVNESTVASVRAQGMTGLTFVSLQAEKAQAPPLQKHIDEPYPIIRSIPSSAFALDNAVAQMTKQVAEVTTNLNTVLGAENQHSLKEILENLTSITALLEHDNATIDRSIHLAEKLLANTEQASRRLPRTLQRLDGTLSVAQKTARDLSKLTVTAQQTLQSGTRSLDNIEQDTIPAVNLTLDKLRRILSNLEQVSEALAHNPSVLVRGVHHDTNGPGE